MSRHAQYEGLGDLDAAEEKGRGARFLKRSSALDARMSGQMEEKTLHWVEPERCRMWARHNRAYELLTPENCDDLISGIRSQGRQEFPAIVRPTGSEGQPYEVICGARRHYAITHLRKQGYTQFKYLIDVRDLTDEEAFRLADIENRDRQDISDFERARDYAFALDAYYGGKQVDMARRLEVSEGWLSRQIALAKMPQEVVDAFERITQIGERTVRPLLPMLKGGPSRAEILAEARRLKDEQQIASVSVNDPVPPADVVRRLTAAGKGAGSVRPAAAVRVLGDSKRGLKVRRSARSVSLQFPATATEAELRGWIDLYLRETYGD